MPITESVRERRLQLASHVYRDEASPVNMTVLCQPEHGTFSKERSHNPSGHAAQGHQAEFNI